MSTIIQLTKKTYERIAKRKKCLVPALKKCPMKKGTVVRVLEQTPVYIKTNRNNPLIRTTKPERNIMQKRGYSTSNKEIKTENKVDQVQTWSDYLYPYFTSEYYYAGQVVTTVAVVATAAVVYVYVAPAVASYWYGTPTNNPTNNPTTNTATDTQQHTIDHKQHTIEYLQNNIDQQQHTIDQQQHTIDHKQHTIEYLQNNIDHLKNNIKIQQHTINHLKNNIDQQQHTIDQLKDNIDQLKEVMVPVQKGYLEAIKDSKLYTSEYMNKIKNSLKPARNEDCQEYINGMENSKEVKNNVAKFIKYFQDKSELKMLESVKHQPAELMNQAENINVVTEDKIKLLEAFIFRTYAEIAVINIEGKGHSNPEMLETAITNLEAIQDGLPLTFKYIPMLLKYTYNMAAWYKLLNTNVDENNIKTDNEV